MLKLDNLKVLCPEPDSFSAKGLNLLSKNLQLTCRKINQTEFDKIANNFDAILIRFNTKVGSKVINKKSKIKFIICPTTGTDHLDLKTIREHKVEVFNLFNKSYFLNKINASAEHTFALMLALLRKIPQAFDDVKKNQWNSNKFIGRELYSKTIGIIGYGRIGKKLSKYCRSFGMSINVYDPYLKINKKYISQKSSIIELIKNSDIISLHVPLNKKNKNLLGKKEFDSFKKGSFLINTSRGAIISTNYLINSLKNKKIIGAALDVIEEENHIPHIDNKLIKYSINHNNLLITPHIAGSTKESIELTDLFVIKNFLNIFNL